MMMDKAKGEVLRYLGHRDQEIPAQLEAQVIQAMAECRSLARPAHIARIFPVRLEEDVVRLEGTSLELVGQAIRKHLEQAVEAEVLAATLGVGVEQAIRRYEYTDLTYALLLDAAATQLIEEVCDSAEAEIRRQAEEQGQTINFRFSPGYGDLPLDIQPKLLETLQAGKRIGLTCTDSLILTPRKSVTAFIGLLPSEAADCTGKQGCAGCDLAESCRFRGMAGGCGR